MIITAAAVLVVLGAVVWLTLGAPGWSREGGAASGARWGGGLLRGFLATVAATQFGVLTGSAGTPIVSGCLGVAFAVVAHRFLPLRAVLGAVFGVLGVVGSIGGYLRTSGCASTGSALSVTFLVLLVVIAAAAAALRALLPSRIIFTLGRNRWELADVPLALFGAVETLYFFARPLGVDLLSLSTPALALVAGLVAAVLFGWLVGIAPVAAMGFGSAAVLVTSVVIEAGYGDACSSTPSWGVIIAGVCFVVPYLLVRMVIGRIRL